MELKELEVYQIAMQIGEVTWNLIKSWEYFQKNTLGRQWVEAADSISANISEGEGRFNYPDRR